MRRALLGAALCAGLAGCAGAGAPDGPPATTGVARYVDALRADDARAAYALLADEVRAQVPFEAFATAWKQAATERRAQARALEERLQRSGGLGERAAVRYRDGKRVHLARGAGGWLLESALVSQAHAGRPRDAVTMLADALTDRSYRGLLAALTSERRDAIAAQVDDFLSSLQAHRNDPIERIGEDRAELRWDSGDQSYRIVLRREGDEWRVHDLHIAAAPAGD
jgi:hypothetical protein